MKGKEPQTTACLGVCVWLSWNGRFVVCITDWPAIASKQQKLMRVNGDLVRFATKVGDSSVHRLLVQTGMHYLFC